MRSLLLVVTANFRRRKLQNLLIGIVVGVSALLFATALGIMGGMHRPFEAMFERQNASHMLLMFDQRMHDPGEISRWWEGRAGVAAVTGITNLSEDNLKVKHNGEELKDLVVVAEMPAGDITVDRLALVEGDQARSPGRGEIWIPTSFAYGNRIGPGDTITVETGSGPARFTVTAVVVDPYYSSGFIHPVRLWVGPGELARIYEAAELNPVTLGIRLTDPALMNSLWKEFESYLEGPFGGFRLSHDLVRFSYLTLLNIISMIMMLFSVVIVLVTLYIIFSTIATSVISDYKDIGILKSQGVTTRGVVAAYLLQYGLLSLAAVAAGLAGSIFAIRLLLGTLARSLGLVSYDPALLIPYLLLTLVILTAVVLLAALLSARAAGRIKPAQAIRYGAPVRQFKRGKGFSLAAVKRLPVPALLGLKQVLTDRRQAFFTFFFFTVTSFVLVFSVNSFVSVVQMGDNLPMWGFDESDLHLAREDAFRAPAHDTLLDELRADSMIKHVVPMGWVGSGIIPETPDHPSQNIIGNFYDGNLADLKMLNLEGEHPTRDNEISLAVNTARQYGVQVGDQFEIYFARELHVFTVTGIYQHVNNMGQGFRVQQSALQGAIPDLEPWFYALVLHDAFRRDREAVIAGYEKKYGDAVSVSKPEDAMASSMEEITLNVGIAMAILGAVFTVVLAVIIVNTTVLNIQREKKLYGIMKGCGMTPAGLRLSLLARTAAAALPGILAGVPAGLWLAPSILSVLMLQMGIANYPAVIHVPGTLAAVLAALCIAVLSTWIPSGKVMKISSRNLIVE